MNSKFLADAGYLVRNGISSWAISTGNDLLKKIQQHQWMSLECFCRLGFIVPNTPKKKKEKKKKIRLKCGEGDSRLIFGVRDERGRQNE
jgi:hypothetical protein